METKVMTVGLDYHSESIQACVLDASGRVLRNVAVGNDWRAVTRCVGAHHGPGNSGTEIRGRATY